MPTPKPLVLVVEDEKEMAELIITQLELAGMQTQEFNRTAPALRFLKSNFANLMLLDVNLPDGSGFNLIEDMRNEGIQIPVIFITGNTSENHKVKGLELGGDDYITKPFSFPELIARINAVLRRTETARDTLITENASVSSKDFEFCGATVFPARLEILFPDGSVEKIGRKELGILAYLVDNPHVILTRRSLIHSVWGIHADVRSRSLDQYIVKIREMFSRHEMPLDTFRTIHGVGYIYDPAPEK